MLHNGRYLVIIPDHSIASRGPGKMYENLEEGGSAMGLGWLHLSCCTSAPCFEGCKQRKCAADTWAQLSFAVQGPSPDEVALVEGGRQLGFEFVKRV